MPTTEEKKEEMQLKKRWLALWKRIGGKTDGDAEWAEIVARYAESHRMHHVLLYIEHCLRELDEVKAKRNLLINPDAVEVALWFHDIVNDTTAEAISRKDNEKKSAELWLKIAKKGQVPEAFRDYVAKLILPTNHSDPAYGLDGRYVQDIDLAILGRPWREFDDYEDQIRFEYSWASDEDFAKERKEILGKFLARPLGIYTTQFFKEKYEMQARRNLKYSIARLSDRL